MYLVSASSDGGLCDKLSHPKTSEGRLPLGTARRDLLRWGNRISEDDLGQAILVFGIRVGDVGLSFLENGLAEGSTIRGGRWGPEPGVHRSPR